MKVEVEEAAGEEREDEDEEEESIGRSTEDSLSSSTRGE
jgi:hypothetical protein